MTSEQIGTSSKKVRGRAKASEQLIEAMYDVAEAAQPITGRGIGYKLFTRGLIESMKEMPRVYRLLRIAREEGIVPWDWIVDETRALERTATWKDPEAYARCVARSYRRDFWINQSVRCKVASEKGTVRGVLAPVLEEYAVGFQVMHGFTSATCVHDIAEDWDERPLFILYVGDFDPSGLYMSEKDLPARLEKYDGAHASILRIALTESDTVELGAGPSFSATDKRKDPRYQWFVSNHGDRCWELDAMDPNELRVCVEGAIQGLLDREQWDRCAAINKAEQENLRDILKGWKGRASHD